MMFDYYKILGVSETATDKEIKNALKNKLKEHHPDKLNDNANIELEKTKFYLIKEAGDTLTNPQNKRAYDLSRKQHKTLNNDYKTEFNEYIKNLQNNEEPSTNIQQPEKIERDAPENTLRRYEDIVIEREQNDIENTKQNIFKDKQFDPNTFNTIFEKNKKRAPETAIVNYEEMPGIEGLNKDNYAELDNGEHVESSLSDTSSSHIQPTPTPVNIDYEKYIRERKQSDELLQKQDFKRMPQEMPPISKDFGHMIGNQMGGTERENTIYKQIIMDAYNAITGTLSALI